MALALALGACVYAAQAGAYFAALERIEASLLSLLVYTFPAMLTVVALGALLQNSAAAIVASFAAPLAITAIASIPQLKHSLIWIDQARTLGPLTDDTLSATEWAHAGTTLIAWLAIPLAIGAWRLMKGEIR